MKNFEHKKSLGQNFLIDKNIVLKIIKSIDLKPKSLIIEIGPGDGALTKELINLDSNIICFEIDKRLEEPLKKIKSNNLEIIFEDFLSIDLKKFLSTKSYNYLYFVANLPYYITSQIINKIYNESNCYQMILMVQSEVASRFMAKPSTKEYGSMSVFLQYNYKISKVATVSKNCFFPKPKIDSAVIKFQKLEVKEYVKNEEHFYKLVRDSFCYKRKNLRNNLKNYDLEKINKTLENFGKNLTVRAEALSIEELAAISNSLL